MIEDRHALREALVVVGGRQHGNAALSGSRRACRSAKGGAAGNSAGTRNGIRADWNVDLVPRHVGRHNMGPYGRRNVGILFGRSRSVADAKFAGSGGAIVGLYDNARQYQELVDALGRIRCTVLRPMIYPA